MNNNREDSEKKRAGQGVGTVLPEPFKIGASTPYDFSGRHLTAYGGLLPIATMLEKLGFQQLVEETLTVKRLTRVMPAYQFVVAMVMALYVGFSRLNHLVVVFQEGSVNLAVASSDASSGKSGKSNWHRRSSAMTRFRRRSAE